MKRNLPLLPLTLLALLASGCQVFPYVGQATQDTPEALEEATLEPSISQPTATLIPSPSPTPTPEEIPETVAESAAEEPIVPTPTPQPTYTLQEGSPVALPNFNHPQAGCGWLGVAGQVFDKNGLEMLGLTVLVGDTENPEEDSLAGITGEALAYGLGGFEIQIAEEPLDSTERFWVQVLNGEDVPLTARHAFDTYQDCEKNLILINFIPLDESAMKAAPTPTVPAYP
jgi:hypothetical protein